MKHCILAKFKPEVAKKQTLYERIRAMFSEAEQISGVHGVEVYTNCIDRSNRYDVMIVLDMDREALAIWDDSALHHSWKETFGELLEKKAIFDHE